MTLLLQHTTLYHGTSTVYLPSLHLGIRPTYGDNFDGTSQLGPGFYTTPQFEAATYFAGNAALKQDGTPVVVHVILPVGNLQGMIVPEWLWWNVPADLLNRYDYLEAPISGLPMWQNIKFNPFLCSQLQIKE